MAIGVRSHEIEQRMEDSNMICFYCTDCQENINGLDNESAEQILSKLDEHIAKCRLAQFTFEGATDIGRRRAADFRAILRYNRSGKLPLLDS
jgi:hypothetical protein